MDATEYNMISNLRFWRVRLMPPSPGVRMETAGILKVHSGLPFYTIFHPGWQTSSLQDFLGSSWIILTAVSNPPNPRHFFFLHM